MRRTPLLLQRFDTEQKTGVYLRQKSRESFVQFIRILAPGPGVPSPD